MSNPNGLVTATLTHVAVLVPSLDNAVKYVQNLGLEVNPFEEFEHEGTRECYVGSPKMSARLLLLEAIKDGPYQHAMKKRGPGLHHLGVWIPNLEEYAAQLGKAGWLLHTQSLVAARKQKTAYFARPTVPYMVEAYENVAPVGKPSIECLELGPSVANLEGRTNALQINNSIIKVPSQCNQSLLHLEGRKIVINDLL